jgi:chromatin segregation and condensation protein Rec8/ScpA/Scc1 (kleisin family)
VGSERRTNENIAALWREKKCEMLVPCESETWMAKIDDFDADLIQQLSEFGSFRTALTKNAQLDVRERTRKHYVERLCRYQNV